MHVRFATPCYSGKPVDAYLESMKRAVAAVDEVSWKVSYEIVMGDCYVQRARNSLAAAFLKTDATHLFYIDDDVEFPADAVIRLLASNHDVAFGVYPIKGGAPGDYPIVIEVDEKTFQPLGRKGWISATGAPGGFLCIKRHVIEKLYASYPDHLYEDFARDGTKLADACDIFPQGVHHGRWWGEDFGFCNLWRDIGGTIWCWPDITFGHVDRRTGEVYRGNYHEFLLSQPREAA